MGRPPKPWYRASSKTWVCKIDGRLVTLGRSHREAVQAFHTLRSIHSRGEPLNEPDAKLRDLVARFLAYQAKRLSLDGYNSYRQWLNAFGKRFRGDRLASKVDPEEVTRWLEGNPSWNQTTRYIIRSRIKALYKVALREGWIARDPMAKLTGPGSLSRETALSPKQYAEVIARVDGGLRELLVFLWETGCRPSEAFRLRWRDVDLAAGLCTFAGKTTRRTGKPRQIFLTPIAVSLLRASQPTCDARESVFVNAAGRPWTTQSLGARLLNLRNQLGCGAELSPSGFRRGFATDGALKLTPHVLAHLLGHSNAGTVSRHYAKLANRRAEIFGELAKIRPPRVPPRSPAKGRSGRLPRFAGVGVCASG